MTATFAARRSIAAIRTSLWRFENPRSIRLLTAAQRGVVLVDWFREEVGLTADQMEELGNRLTAEAWEMRRDRDV